MWVFGRYTGLDSFARHLLLMRKLLWRDCHLQLLPLRHVMLRLVMLMV